MSVIRLAERINPAPLPGDAARKDWAARISARWQDSVEAIIDTGRLLADAKLALGHGNWLAMFHNKEVPFGERTAQRLMSVADDGRLSNTTHVSYLPQSWGTLYELTKLDDATFDAAMEAGDIRPDMKREDVNRIRDDALRATGLLGSAAPEPSDATCTTLDLGALVGRGLRFGAIYADPPWLYGNQGTRGATSNHYGGMSVEEIAAMPVRDLAADNAHLHLWTTNAFLFDCKAIMEAWGFEYKSCFVWVKPQIGMGNYWRLAHEFLLLGVRGSCPFKDRSQISWLQEPRTKHSAKPESVRKLIELVSPGPFLELFGRRVAPGWTVWGNQIERTMFEASVEELK